MKEYFNSRDGTSFFSFENLGDESYIDRIRSKISDVYLLIASFVLVPVLAGLIHRAMDVGWQSVQTITLILLVAWWLIALFRKYFSHEIRSYVSIVCFFSGSTSGLINIGLLSSGMLGYLNCCLLTAIFFGVRKSLIMIAICFVSVSVIAYGHTTGFLSVAIDASRFNVSSGSWSFSTILLIVTSGSLIFCWAAITGALVTLIDKVREQGAQLKQRHDHLEVLVAARTQELTKEIDVREARERSLKASEERFKSFTGIATNRYWESDENHIIIFAPNLSPEVVKFNLQIKGKKPWELDVDLSEEDKVALKAAMESKKEFRDLPVCWLMPNGKKYYRKLSGDPMRDSCGKFQGYRVIGIDETAEVTAQNEVQAIQKRFFDALTQFDIGVVLWDPEGKLQFFNKALFWLYPQWSDVYEIGLARKKLCEVMWQYSVDVGETSKDKDTWFKDFSAIADTPSVHYSLSRPDGGRSKVYRRRLADGWVIGLHMDDSESNHREWALAEAKKQVEVASAVKDKFLKSVSFELRTPINAILGFGQLVSNDNRTTLTENQFDYLDGIKSSGECLLDLVDDILQLATEEES